jgi:peroxiredoxin
MRPRAAPGGARVHGPQIRVRGPGRRGPGLSKDSLASHKKFAEKQNLTITLLSDPDKAVLNQLGAIRPKVMYGKKVEGVVRSTLLIGPDGMIRALAQGGQARGACGGGAGSAAEADREVERN